MKEDNNDSNENKSIEIQNKVSPGYTKKIQKLYDDFKKIMEKRYQPIVPSPEPSASAPPASVPPAYTNDPIDEKRQNQNQNVNNLLKEKKNFTRSVNQTSEYARSSI